MKKTICVVGSGNLGSRYLEGIGSCKNEYNIYSLIKDKYNKKNHMFSL